VFEDETVEKAAASMAEQQVQRMPVLNREKRLVGIVSVGDLARDAGGGVAGRRWRASRAPAGNTPKTPPPGESSPARRSPASRRGGAAGFVPRQGRAALVGRGAPPHLEGDMTSEPLIRLGVFVCALGLLLALERLVPWRRGPLGARRWFPNLGLAALGSVVVRFTVPAAAVGAAAWAEARGIGLWPALGAPFWVSVPASMVLLELLIYWQHRWTHTVPRCGGCTASTTPTRSWTPPRGCVSTRSRSCCPWG
jgi:hypothetical protein